MEVQNPKIKKSTLIKSKETGGLEMIDFKLFDKALKICWVRCLCSEGNQLWKLIPLRYITVSLIYKKKTKCFECFFSELENNSHSHFSYLMTYGL